MTTTLRFRAIFLGLTLILALGCSKSGSNTEEENILVPPGKLDNYFSPTAQEYFVEGTSSITLEEEYRGKTEEEKQVRIKELIFLKHIQIGWFLNVYLVEKSSHDDNQSYGGFHAMTRNGAYDDLKIEAVDELTYRFTFKQQVGGKKDFLRDMPTETDEQGNIFFTLKMKKVSNSEMSNLEYNHEWYRSYDSFDPSKYTADQLEEIKLQVYPQKQSVDAYLDYKRLFEDGEVTIGVHFGWDYHSDYHLKHSQSVYEYLVSKGFASPVASFDLYTRTSGPLTKTIKANGKDVVVKVWLFWGKPGTDTDPDTDEGGKLLEADMRESFRDREIIIFSGHSGNYYAFALANWRKTDEGDLDDHEIPSLEMPKDRYQIVAAIGCDTYSVGEAFFQNPAKSDRKNINVITTLSFSSAGSDQPIRTLIDAVSSTDAQGNHNLVRTYKQILDEMDRSSWFFQTMFGVYGIDANPKLHPYGNVDALCKSCTQNTDCGGLGNSCVRITTDEKVCTIACTADDGCPSGYVCREVANGTSISGKFCVPEANSCHVAPPVDNGPKVIINEVLADPPSDETGDSNGDGTRSSTQDEFVELVNVTNETVDISGWSLSDSYSVRFTFPAGTALAPGQAVLVFGGGDTTKFKSFGRTLVFAASTLGLSNGGDKVTLRDATNRSVNEVEFGPEGGQNRSLVREKDGDPTSKLVLHPGTAPFSAGTKTDGSAF